MSSWAAAQNEGCRAVTSPHHFSLEEQSSQTHFVPGVLTPVRVGAAAEEMAVHWPFRAPIPARASVGFLLSFLPSSSSATCFRASSGSPVPRNAVAHFFLSPSSSLLHSVSSWKFD